MATAQRTLPGMRGFLGHTHGEAVAVLADALVCVIPGIKLKTLNTSLRGVTRGAMFAKAASTKKLHEQVIMVLRSKFGAPPSPPLTVTITRIAPCELDDDNVVGSAKGVRDSVAKWLGVDDRTKRSGVAWRYEQTRGRPREYGVGIRIERRES